MSLVRFTLPCILVAAASCSSSTPQSAPAPAPAPTPATQTAASGEGRGGGPGQAGGGRAQLTPEQRAARRDSLHAARDVYIAALKTKIAGHDSEPASQVFSNIQVMKTASAGQLLDAMGAFGNALGVNCTFCHVSDQWEADDRQGKKTARMMIGMVTAINTEQLSKLPPNRNGQTPRINCTTCHRGYQTPNGQLVP